MTASPRTTLTTPALIVMCATIFGSVNQTSMSSLTLPDIQARFGVEPDALAWVVTAYLIPFATGTVIYGRLADMFGSKRMYLFGMCVFTGASLLVAAAPSYPLLIAARVLQGMGGTAVPAMSLATIIRTTAPIDRGRAMGATVLAVGLGFATGPILGGWLVSLGGWRLPFLVSGGFGFILTPLAFALVPKVAASGDRAFDIPGAIACAASVTGMVLAINRLPAHPDDLLGLAGGLLAFPLLAILIWRIRTAPAPFINREIAGNRRFWALSALGFTSQGSHFAIVVMAPLLLTGVHGSSSIEAGLYMLPGALAIAACGMGGGILLNRLGPRALLISGAGVLASGMLLAHLAAVGWGPAGIAALYVVVAVGYGLVQAAVITAATGSLPERLAGVGSGTFNLLFFLGGAVTVALSGAILRRRAGAEEAWNGLVSGDASRFSDAALVVVVVTAIGFLLALWFAPRRSQPG
ncbi:MAG: MFS transporter [Dehalococcoidia bacterium]